MDDVFEFVEQLLSAANAESWDQDCALVAQRMLEHFFQSRTSAAAIFVQTIAVGAFDDQNIGFVWDFRRRKNWRCLLYTSRCV